MSSTYKYDDILHKSINIYILPNTAYCHIMLTWQGYQISVFGKQTTQYCQVRIQVDKTSQQNMIVLPNQLYLADYVYIFKAKGCRYDASNLNSRYQIFQINIRLGFIKHNGTVIEQKTLHQLDHGKEKKKKNQSRGLFINKKQIDLTIEARATCLLDKIISIRLVHWLICNFNGYVFSTAIYIESKHFNIRCDL